MNWWRRLFHNPNVPTIANLAWIVGGGGGGGLPGAKLLSPPGTSYPVVALGDPITGPRVVYHMWNTVVATGRSVVVIQNQRTFVIFPVSPSPSTVVLERKGILARIGLTRKPALGGYCVAFVSPGFLATLEQAGVEGLLSEQLRPDEIRLAPGALVLTATRWLCEPGALRPLLDLGSRLASRLARVKEADRAGFLGCYQPIVDAGQARLIAPASGALLSLAPSIEDVQARLDIHLGPGTLGHANLAAVEKARWPEAGTWFTAHADSTWTLKVLPKSLWESLKTLLGSQDIKVGDATFDRRFVIKGNSEEEAQRVLDASLRQSITAAADLADGQLFMDLSLTSLTIRKKALLLEPDQIALFMKVCMDIFERLVGRTLRDGIRILAVAREPGRCPVCGSTVTQPVRCPECQAEQHSECWVYLGRCATYGCSGAVVGPATDAPS